MRIHHALPHVSLLKTAGPTPFVAGPPPVRADAVQPGTAAERKQRLQDLIAVGAVLLLILATAVVIVSYVIHEIPSWQQGQMAAFVPTPAVVAEQEAAARSAVPSSPASDVINGLGRVPLILISTAVEMAIFVALGLYLRHDMNRKP